MNLVPVADVLEGEIVDGDCIQVTIADHPLNAKWRVEFVPAGKTVSEIIDRVFDGRDCSVVVDSCPTPFDSRGDIVPLESMEIVGVPGKRVRRVLRKIATIAVAIIAAVIAPVLAGPIISALGITVGGIAAGIVTSVVGAGLTIAGSIAVNALFPASAPQLASLSGSSIGLGLAGSQSTAQQAAVSPTYSIGGARNTANLYGPVPVILGEHRVSPPYGAGTFTENIGDDQFLRMILVWGIGPLEISDIKIGETPISNFDDLEIETVQGLPGDPELTLYPEQVFQEDLNITLDSAVTDIRRTADDINEFIIDIEAPGGVFRFQKSTGNLIFYTVNYNVSHRVLGGGSWTEVLSSNVNGNVQKPIRHSLRFPVAAGTYDIKVERTTGTFSGEDTVSDTLVWSALRSVRTSNPIVTDVPLAMTALRVRATGQLSGVIATLNGTVKSLVTSWNGSSWVTNTVSSNPADLCRHVLQGAGNLRPVPDSEIDLVQFAAWADYCTAKGFTFNQVRDFRASVWDTLGDIVAAGRGLRRFQDGKWSVAWDDQNDLVCQHFGPNNSSGFNGARGFTDLPHAFRARFVNKDKGYRQDERVVYDDGFSLVNATKFEGFELVGITEPDLIWRHTRYHLAQLRLRREGYQLTTDFEHLQATRGDRVRVSHDVLKVGLGFGRVKSISGEVVTLSGDVTIEAGKTYGIRFRLLDGTDSLRTVTTGVGTTSIVALLTDAGETPPQDGDLYHFGETGLESIVCRVKGITPGPDMVAVLELVDDAPAIHAADTGPIPSFDPQISEPTNIFEQPPRKLLVVEFLEFGGGGLSAGVNLSWLPPTIGLPDSYNYEFKLSSDTEWSPPANVPAGTLAVAINDLQGGSYDFRVQSMYGAGASKFGEIFTLNVTGPFAVPDDVTGFLAAISGTNIILSWASQASILIKDYVIRFAPLLTGVTWESASPVSSGTMGTAATLPYAKGTYLIKARTHRDILSKNATLIVSGVEPVSAFNVVETVTDDPGFAGTYFDTYFDGPAGGVILDAQGEFFDGTEFFTAGEFFTDSRDVIGYYTLANSIDIGAVATSRLSAILGVSGFLINSQFFSSGEFFDGGEFFDTVPAQWDMTTQVRTTDDDPTGSPTWSAWFDFTVSDYTARAFQFRLKFESFTPLVSPLLTSAVFTVDMPDRTIAFDDVQSTGSGTSLSFSPAFVSLKNLQITGQDMATGDYYEVLNKTNSGAAINFFDAGGVKVDRKFDAQALGYGSTA